MKKNCLLFTFLLLFCVVFCSCKLQNNVVNVTSATTTKDSTVFASTTQNQYYRKGYSCNQIEQSDYEKMSKYVHSEFDINKNETKRMIGEDYTIYGHFDDIFRVEMESYVQSESYYNNFSNFTSSKSANAFFKHYFTKYLNANYNFKTGKKNENSKLIQMNDTGYEITNFTCDYDNMFYYSSAFFLDTQDENSKNETLKSQFEKLLQKDNKTFLSAPIYYKGEFAGLLTTNGMGDSVFSNSYEPLKEILNIVKSKSNIDKWCKSFGITEVQDVIISPAFKNYVGHANTRSIDGSYGLILYVKTSNGDYAYTNNIMGLSKYNGKMTKIEELIKNSDEYNRLCKEFPIFDFSTG